MTDYPIIFSAPMVRALLDGRKTMTRRLAWQPPRACILGSVEFPSPWKKVRPGDRLWVREAWRTEARHDGIPPRDVLSSAIVSFDADYATEPNDGCRGKDRRSFHMPRWASRITLIVTATKLERLKDISEEDALAEGISPLPSGRFYCGFDEEGEITCKSPVTAYAWLWDSLHGEDAWAANPEVVALTFRVIRENIDRIKEVNSND